MSEGQETKTLSALEAVAECLRICDMFADENMEMATDTLMHPVKLRQFMDGWHTMSDVEMVTFDKLSMEGIVHSSQAHAARDIAKAIRERFGIVPPKSGE
jgi:hypothetical protein